jgi:hypothetical protein
MAGALKPQATHHHGATTTHKPQVLALMPRVRTDLGARLLLVAPSNTAADMLAERLLGTGMPKSQLLRVCAYARPEGDLPEVLRDVALWDASLGAYQLPSLGVALSKRVLVATPIMAAKVWKEAGRTRRAWERGGQRCPAVCVIECGV